YRPITIALYGAVALAAVAVAWPEKFMGATIALLLFPFTWSPRLGFVGTVLPPFVLVILPAGLAAFAIVARRSHLRINLLDWLVCALVLSAFVSELNAGASHRLSQDLLETLLGPYFAFRFALTAWPQALRRLPGMLMAVGVCLS